MAMGLDACGPQPERAPAQLAPAAVELIPRAELFGDPARHMGQLSPGGDRIAFLASRDGVMNLWVMSVDAIDEPRPVTDERSRGLRTFRWSADGATLLYLQDDNGDENWRLFAVSAAGEAPPRALTPAGARAEILGVSAADPGGVVVSLNARDRDWPDVFRVDLAGGATKLLQQNTGYAHFALDRDNRVRLGLRARSDGGYDVETLDGERQARTLFTIPFEDALVSRPLAFEAGGQSLLMLEAAGAETSGHAALVRIDLASGGRTVLGAAERADVVDVWLDPSTNAPKAFATEYLRREWRAIDADAQADIDFLAAQLAGEFSVASRSADNTRWIVVEEGPAMPAQSYLYDRTARRLTSLFRHRPALDLTQLSSMATVEIQARDGLTLVSYLTLPLGADPDGDGRPAAPLPLVLSVHDGPWERVSYGFVAQHQWLANRGYAVLSVNFRGSAGFGQAFLNAGNGEWGGRIQHDLADAAQWAVANGVAQPQRMAIAGEGFGGYATLAALTFSPDRFSCGVSFGAPVNLFAYLDRAPAPVRTGLYRRIADARAESGRQRLREQSPLFHAGRARAPVLLALGARDARTSRLETDQLAQTLRLRGKLTYLVFPNEGADLVRPQDRLSYLAVMEHFLADCLGGRTEPVGASFEGADIQVYDGAVNVPGLSAFARRPAAPRATEGPAAGAGVNEDEAPDAAAPLAPLVEAP
jgi:dipeptidyl aminopeptidase/acylaminoacyl peptidase